MADLIQTIIESDVSELQTLLGDMFQPAVACILVLASIVPIAGLVECLCLLVRIIAGGAYRE